MKLVSPQGRIALPLILLAALCFLDQHLNAVDVIRPSWLVVAALSFPLGWLATWLAETIASGKSLLAPCFVFLAGTVGTVLNIYLLASCTICFLFRRDHAAAKRQQKVLEEDFQRLLYCARP